MKLLSAVSSLVIAFPALFLWLLALSWLFVTTSDAARAGALWALPAFLTGLAFLTALGFFVSVALLVFAGFEPPRPDRHRP